MAFTRMHALTFLLVTTLLSGCGKPIFEFRAFNVSRIAPNLVERTLDLDVEFVCRLRNPFGFELPLRPPFLSLEAGILDIDGGAYVGSVTLATPAPVSIEPNGDAEIRIRHGIRLTTALQFDSLTGRDVPYEVSMNLRFSPPGPWSGSVPLKYAGSLRIPRAPIVAWRAGNLPRIELIANSTPFAPLQVIAGIKLLLDGIAIPAIDALPAADRDDVRKQWNCLFGIAPSSGQCPTLVDPTTITGVDVLLPLVIKNDNQFPIKMPRLNIDLSHQGTAAFEIVAQGAGVSDTLAASEERAITYRIRVRPGVIPLVPTPTDLTFSAEWAVDLGYGEFVIPLDVP